MSQKILVSGGDFLSTRNTRSGSNIRQDDISSFHRMDYIHPLSQLFHFDMNASESLMNTHAINSINDAGSLSRQKDVLHRVFDIKKPPYADAKSLIVHSLTARILDCSMFVSLP